MRLKIFPGPAYKLLTFLGINTSSKNMSSIFHDTMKQIQLRLQKISVCASQI